MTSDSFDKPIAPMCGAPAVEDAAAGGVRAPSRRWWIVLIAITILAATALRSTTLGESLWLDELHTAWVVQGRWSELIDRAAVGNHPPVYFALVKLVTQAAGLSERSLRAVSWFASVGCLIGTACWLWRRVTPQAVLAGVVTLALCDNCVWYAQESRSYALVQLLGWMHLALWVRAIQHGRWADFLAAQGLLVLMIYTHYLAVLIAAGPALYLLCCWLARVPTGHDRWLKFVATTAAGLVLCWPAMAWSRSMLDTRGQWHSMFETQGIWRTLVVQEPARTLAIVWAGLALWAWWRRHRRQGLLETSPKSGTATMQPVAITWVWMTTPLLLVPCFWLLKEPAPLHARYLQLIAAGPAILVGLLFPAYSAAEPRQESGLSAGRLPALLWIGRHLPALQGAAWAMLAVVIFLAPASTLRWPFSGVPRHSTEDWRAAVNYLNAELQDQPYPVLLRSGLAEVTHDSLRSPVMRGYALSPVTSLYPLERNSAWPVDSLASLDAATWTAEHSALVQDAGGVWLLLRGSQKFTQAIVRKTMDQQAAQGLVLREGPAFSAGGVNVYLLMVQQDSTAKGG